MDVIRRNTDYAIRAMVNLAVNQGKGAVTASQIAKKEGIPYDLACKLLQQLHRKKIVKSVMGAKGGFLLRKKASNISILEVIEAIQGPVSLNRCLLDARFCSRKKSCPVSKNLAKLQKTINKQLKSIKLSKLAGSGKKNYD
jgi:Rrf2 family iron-sulfur cluster assembly transcriptional regulator